MSSDEITLIVADTSSRERSVLAPTTVAPSSTPDATLTKGIIKAMAPNVSTANKPIFVYMLKYRFVKVPRYKIKSINKNTNNSYLDSMKEAKRRRVSAVNMLKSEATSDGFSANETYS